jgi:hypothetical protein
LLHLYLVTPVRKQPDFLQFRLQVLDDGLASLKAGPVAGAEGEAERPDTKRAMLLEEPRALPFLGGGEEPGDDAIFTSEWAGGRQASPRIPAVVAATSFGAVVAVLGVGFCYHR